MGLLFFKNSLYKTMPKWTRIANAIPSAQRKKQPKTYLVKLAEFLEIFT
jgi:hypothetical protein